MPSLLSGESIVECVLFPSLMSISLFVYQYIRLCLFLFSSLSVFAVFFSPRSAFRHNRALGAPVSFNLFFPNWFNVGLFTSVFLHICFFFVEAIIRAYSAWALPESLCSFRVVMITIIV